MFGPLIQKIVLNIKNWNENKVIIVLNIMNWNQNRVKILWVQYKEWKQGKIFQRKKPGEPGNKTKHFHLNVVSFEWFSKELMLIGCWEHRKDT